MSTKGEFLGQGVVTLVGTGEFTGKQRQVALLTEDEGDGSYVGVVFLESHFFQEYFKGEGKGTFSSLGKKATGAVPVRVSGLRRYPYTERPNHWPQFVLPGEDTEPLRAIMQASADAYESGTPIGQEPIHEVIEDEQGRPQEFHPADKDHDGRVSPKEQRQYDREQSKK